MADIDLKATEKDLIKSGVLIGAEFLLDKPPSIIPVSPAADLKLGGGIPGGSWVAFSGNPKCGKTTLALHIIAKAQALGRTTFYIDVEHRLKQMHLTGIKGLKLAKKPGDTSGLQLIRSTRERILSAEELMTAAGNLLKDHPGCVMVIDSTSALCSAGEMNSDVTGKGRALGPRILAEFCRMAGPVVPVNDCVVISIQHLITNTSGYGATYMADSGRKIQYQGDVMQQCKSVKPWLEGDKQIGQQVEWKVLWSALGPPGATIINWLRYGVGIDEVAEVIDIGLDFGLISKGGAWYDIPYFQNLEHKAILDFVKDKDDKEKEKAFKFQGRAKLCALLTENEIFHTLLYDQIRAMI